MNLPGPLSHNAQSRCAADVALSAHCRCLNMEDTSLPPVYSWLHHSCHARNHVITILCSNILGLFYIFVL